MPFPVDIQYIHEAEQTLGVQFPATYTSRMLKQNGGEIETEEEAWQLFPFFDQSDNKRISRTCNHLLLETAQARKWENFPAEGVAIAANGTGDHLVLLPADDQKKLQETIYLWLHETGQLSPMAASIIDFTR